MIDGESRRRFNSSERVALFLTDGGVCALCGVDLGKGWHADHVEPWARGGNTDVVNGQALCPACNLKKGAQMPSELRKWQMDAINRYLRHPSPDFLAEATPGAGKTRFAAEVCSRLCGSDTANRIVWVVPSDRLRKQTADAVRKATGLLLHYTWSNGDGAFPPSPFHGVVVTYHSVASEPALWRAMTSRARTLVILDEVHHGHNKKTWGEALRRAFEPAVRRLLLSGTPFRSDGGAIPFVHYVDGRGQPDYSYGYSDALGDEVVRTVIFPRIGGYMEWSDDEGEQGATFEEKLDEQGESRRLRTALDAAGGHIGGMLAQAHRELLAMREEDPDAAGLIIAMDQIHAARIADRMRRELAIDPVIAVSDNPGAGQAIEQFATGASPWIVAVRMVSEGVDIPRLRIAVYATNIVTELYFRQAVGRVIRRDDQPIASFYIPDDQRLRKFASEIQKQRDAVFEAEEGDDDEGGPKKPGNRNNVYSFSPGNSTATDEGVIVGEHHLSAGEMLHAEQVKLSNPLTVRMNTAEVAFILREGRKHAPPPPPPEQEEVPDIVEILAKLKTRNRQWVSKISRDYGIEWREVNATLNELVGIRTVTTVVDVAILQKRLAAAKDWHRTGKYDREQASA